MFYHVVSEKFLSDEEKQTKSCLDKLKTCHLVDPKNHKAIQLYKSRLGIENEKKRQMKNPYFVIHPYSRFRFIWDIVILVLQFLIYTTFPFNFTKTGSIFWFWFIFYSLTDVLCLADVVLWFFTGFYKKEVNTVIINRLLIARKYIKTYFFFDLISSIPSTPTLFNDSLWFLHWLKFLKICRLVTFFTNLKTLCSKQLGFWTYQIKILQLALIVHFITIWVAAIIVFKLRMEEHDEGQKFNYVFLLQKYTDSISFFFLTFAPFHYSPLATTLTLGLLITGYFVNMVILGTVVKIVYNRSSIKKRYEDYLTSVEQYATYKNLPYDLKIKVIKYFDYNIRMGILNRDEIFRDLDLMPILQKDLMLHDWRHLVEKVQLFQDFPVELINSITLMLKFEVYLSNEIIFDVDAIHNSMYFVLSGTLAIYSRTGIELNHYEDGDHFGINGICFKNQLQKNRVITVTTCELLRLHRKDFSKVLKESPGSLADRSFSNIQKLADLYNEENQLVFQL